MAEWTQAIVEQVLAQLRHAYQQLLLGEVKNQHAFAKGLIEPQIRKLEVVAALRALPAREGAQAPLADICKAFCAGYGYGSEDAEHGLDDESSAWSEFRREHVDGIGQQRPAPPASSSVGGRTKLTLKSKRTPASALRLGIDGYDDSGESDEPPAAHTTDDEERA